MDVYCVRRELRRLVVLCAAIHNNMNDTTWSMLLEWEQWHIQRGEVAGDVRPPTLYPFLPLLTPWPRFFCRG